MRLGAPLMTGLTIRRLSTALSAAFLLAALPSVSPAAVVRRVAHTATLLTTGDVLIAGGVNEAGTTLNTSDIVAASRGSVIIPIATMGVARASHTATLLSNGCVLIAGGNAAATDIAAPAGALTAEIYNPATGGWSPTGSMGTARYNHTATLLNDGRVLICGGQDNAGAALSSCEHYTPTSCTAGAFTVDTPLQQARYNHTAILLKDAKVWFAGGRNPAIVATGGYLPTTERYIPNPAGAGLGTFQSASPMIEARSQHTATLMGDGKALVVGGYNFRDVLANTGITESAEIYDPISNSVSPAASMSARRSAHSVALSADGSVNVFGGLGNVTTTYLTLGKLNLASNAMQAGSLITFGAPIAIPTATVTGGAALVNLDFLLSKAVVGQIQNGEIWLSSPAIRTAWGAINLTPASETVAAIGARILLAGSVAGCRLPFPPVFANCGNIQTPSGAPIGVSQLQGQVVFNRLAIAFGGTPIVTAGNLFFAPTPITAAVPNATLAAGSNFTTTVSISLDKAFIGRTLSGGLINLAAGTTLVQISSFTVDITSGAGVIPAAPITAGPLGAFGTASFPITFTGLEGAITFTGLPPQSYASGMAIPFAGANETVNASGIVTYVTNGANVTGETFSIDVGTIVVRKMIFADFETYNPKTNAWDLFPLEGFVTANERYGHSATLLTNNDLLLSGGRPCALAGCAAQVAQPFVDRPVFIGGLNFKAALGASTQKRAFHTSTLLPDGTILAAGGTNGPSILRSAEIFDPVTETFALTAVPMRYVRDLHTATLLPNGRVLIAGGFTTNAISTGSTNTAEIYYPDTHVFLETTPMISSRSNHTAVMLPDGRVFAAGGYGTNSLGANDVASDTAEIYISTQARWIPAANMPAGCERAIHATVQLKDGRIMLIGGVNSSGVLTTSALYNPTLNTWDCASVPAIGTPAAPAIGLRSHSATLLFDGRVLVAGGNDGLGEANKSFIYDPAGNAWSEPAPLPLLHPRFNHSATLLPNGNVMISGGSQRLGNVPLSIEVFHVNASSWVTRGAVFAGGPRAFHTMTLAKNNKIYGIGGSDGTFGGNGVTLYTSAEAGYFTATPDDFSKNAPPSFRQSTITATSASPFLPATNLTVTGIRFRGGTEAAGGGAAAQNSAHSYPHLILQQVDGSGGAASQSNGGFVVDLTTQIFLNPANFATLDTSLTVALPPTSAGLPFGWYTVRTGANAIYSDAKLVQVGPAKPVAAPANLAGVALGISSMNWTWNVVAGVDGYNVYNATTGVFLATIPVSGAPSYQQTALDPGATTSIMLAGYTLSGDGPLANSPTSYTLSTTPVNVTIASVTFSDLLLYWGTNGNSFPGTTYEVTQSSNNFVTDVSTPVPRLFNLTSNSKIISGLAANTTYFFRIQAFNIVGAASPYSAIVSTRTRSPVTQPVVSGRTTISISWGWADPGGVNNYRVYNATSGVLLGVPVLNSFTEVNLGTNTQNSIRVSAVTTAGEGPLSPSASAYTNAATPGPFVPPVTNLTTGSMLINWTSNGNPLNTTYKLTFTQFAPDGSVVSISTRDVQPFTFSTGYGGLLPSTRYSYTIVAGNGDDLDSDIPPVVVGTTWTLPTAPNPLTLTGTTPNSISVGWATNLNSSSATYQVTYTTDNFVTNIATAPGYAFSDNFRGNTATIPGLVTSATYTIRVIASNPFGQLSQFSNTVTTAPFNGGCAAGSICGLLLSASNSSLVGTVGAGFGRAVTVLSPALAFPTNVTVTISSWSLADHPGALDCSGGATLPTPVSFSIITTPSLQPLKAVRFSFALLPAELGAITSKRALLMRFDPGTNTCVPLETTYDAVNGQMSAWLDHFSLFQVGTTPLSATAGTARIWPNPWYTSRFGNVTIQDIPPDSRVRIFTLRGEQVLDVKANSNGLARWEGTNGSSRSVASGVYLVMIESGGSKKVLKLAVIR